MPPERPRPCTLRLQIEELAALVAGVSGEENRESDEREQEGDDRRPSQRGQRAAGERVGAEAILDLGAGGDRERRERRLLQLGAEVVGPGEPELVRHRRSGIRRVHRDVERALVSEHEVAVGRREAADRPDHANRDRAAREPERQDAAGARRRGEAGRRDHRGGSGVGCLASAGSAGSRPRSRAGSGASTRSRRRCRARSSRSSP